MFPSGANWHAEHFSGSFFVHLRGFYPVVGKQTFLSPQSQIQKILNRCASTQIANPQIVMTNLQITNLQISTK